MHTGERECVGGYVYQHIAQHDMCFFCFNLNQLSFESTFICPALIIKLSAGRWTQHTLAENMFTLLRMLDTTCRKRIEIGTQFESFG